MIGMTRRGSLLILDYARTYFLSILKSVKSSLNYFNMKQIVFLFIYNLYFNLQHRSIFIHILIVFLNLLPTYNMCTKPRLYQSNCDTTTLNLANAVTKCIEACNIIDIMFYKMPTLVLEMHF